MDILLPILPTITSPLIPNVGNTPAISSATTILPQLMNLPTGSMLHGQVSAPRNAQGHVVIKTDKGELALKTDIFMKRGMEIIIRLDKAGEELMAKIISIDGKSVGKYLDALQTSAAESEQDSVIRTPFLTDEAALDTQDIDQRILQNIKQTFSQQNTPILRAVLTSVAQTPLPPADTNVAQPPIQTQPPTTPPAAALAPTAAGTQFSVSITALQLPQQPPIQLDTSVTLAAPLLQKLPQPQAASTEQPTQTQGQPAQDSAPQTTTTTPALLHPPAPPSRANAIAAYQQLQPANNATPPAQPQPLPPQPLSTDVTAAAAPTHPTEPSEPTSQVATKPLVIHSPAPPNTVRVDGVPVPISSAPTTSLPPHTIPAHVLASSSHGELTLQTDLGIMRLLAPEALPVGTTLLLDIKEMKIPNLQTPLTNTAPATSNTDRPLTGMQDLAALIPSSTNSATDFRFSPIPRSGKEMVADVMYFLSALKNGDSQKWLGEKNTRTLQNKHGDLLSRITADFQSLQPNAGSETTETTGQWQQHIFPLMVGGHVEAIDLFHRRHAHDSEEKNKGGTSSEQTDHFVLGVRLTHFGEVQLDGFVRKPPRLDGQKTTFELVIRSQESLPEPVQNDIRTIFTQAQEITGCIGALSFRSGAGACLALNELTPAAKPSAGHQSIIA